MGERKEERERGRERASEENHEGTHLSVLTSHGFATKVPNLSRGK